MTFNRRHFCKLGAKAAGTALALPVLGRSAWSHASGKPSMLISIHCDGGWDPFMVFANQIGNSYFDLDSGITVDKIGKNLSYVSSSNRPAVDTFFNGFGANACIVNGLYCQGLGHADALPYSVGMKDPSTNLWLDWMSYYASVSAPAVDFPHVVIGAPYLPGELSSVSSYLNPTIISELGSSILTADNELSAAEELALANYIKSSYPRSMALYGQQSANYEKLAALSAGLTKEPKLTAFVRSLSIPADDDLLLQHGLIALQLLAKGQSQCVSIQAGTTQQWDTHTNHFTQQNDLFQNLFTNLNALCTEITNQKLQSQVTIIVRSELGRSPKLNKQKGKDHWPYNSALLWGAGVSPGVVVGSYDSYGRGQKISPLFGTKEGGGVVAMTLQHIAAGILRKNGLSSSTMLPNQDPASIVLTG